MTQPDPQTQPEHPQETSAGVLIIRYGLGAVMVGAGIVLLIISPAGLGFDGFALAVGGGLSVVLFNVLFRLGLSSEADREEEERARNYFDEHGEWPEDKPREGRRWTLAPGVVTYEQEQARLHARETAGHAA
ncbi:MAG TPA: hypothetical protein VNV17_03440 [Solirubrobacteraceae bacterium]|nr:hypothetical protein [Solirubrobacteraceae bacterium]